METEVAKNFHLLDLLVLLAYIVGVTIWGVWLARKIKTSDSYFRGDRKFNIWVMIGQSFGTGTHSENFVAQTGITFKAGFSTIWYQWKNMLITPFYWLIAPWYRRSEKTTVGEIVQQRYGNKMGLVYTVFAISYFVFSQGVMLQGAAKVVAIATGDVISPTGVVLFMTVAFILYSFLGGLVASANIMLLQASMIIVLSMMLIPFGLYEVGGYSGMRESLPSEYFTLVSAKSGIGTFTILMLAINGIVGITAQPHILSVCATGNSERAGRIGLTYGSFVKRFCTIGWAFTGIIVAALAAQRGITLEDPEFAFGFAARELLYPGLTGLLVASILAANMSTCSNFMVNTGALFSHDLYNRYINTEANDRQLLWMGRYAGFGLTILGVLFALTIDNVLHAFLFTETIAAFMGIIIFGGILWRRANRYGAAAAIIVSFCLYYVLNYLNIGELKLVYNWEPEPFGWTMLAGFVVLIIVSLITKPENKARTEEFFDNQKRLSDMDDQLKEGEGKPLAGEHEKELLLLDVNTYLSKSRWINFFKRHKEDIIGFFIAWGFVGFLVFIAWLIIQF